LEELLESSEMRNGFCSARSEADNIELMLYEEEAGQREQLLNLCKDDNNEEGELEMEENAST
jgi:hypothetical protein